MSDEEEIVLRYDLAALLQEREEHLQQIKILKTQLLQAGITPLDTHSKSTPDLSSLKRYSLPVCGTKSYESESVLNKRQTSCLEKCETQRQSLSTYDKRSGTNDLGKQYEYVMCAFYAIRFATSDHVSDFEMTTNDEVYGDFDDIALKVKYIDGSTHTYLLQLKHTENKKGLSEKILSAENKDFSLTKYMKTFQILTKKDNVSCILFTNRTAYFRGGSQFCFNSCQVFVREDGCMEFEDLLDTNETPKKSVFQFGTTESDEDSIKVREFLNQFYLFANQKNVSKMKTLITEILKQLLQCDLYDSFIHFMKSWWCGNFVLTKNDVIAKLAELVLSPLIMNISSQKSNEKSKILQDAILKFDMTLVNDFYSDVANQIWDQSEEIREISLTALKYGLTNRGISNFDDLTLEQKSKVLWYLNKVPLIVKVRDSKKRPIQSAIKLLERLETKKKLLLLGNFQKEEFPQWRVFDNLVDLIGCDLYEKIIKHFQVSLQGRSHISLETLFDTSEKIEVIKVRELLLMSQDSLLIGDKKADLPEFYIPRTVSTNFLDAEKVIFQCISSNEVVIINCNSEFRVFLKTKSILFVELCDYERDSECLVLLSTKCTKAEFDNVCSKNSKRRVHLLQILEDKSSILVLSSDNTLKSTNLKYQRSPVLEDEIYSVFDGPVNVLCAQPGIGKSTMIKYLENTCPSDYWGVRVNLRKFNHLLKEEPEEEEILLHFLGLDGVVNKTLLEEVKLLFFRNRKIYLFLDGLDEIESNCVDFALDYVEYIASTGVHVWISSRQNLEEVITTRLNVFPIDIQELNQEEQAKYIEQRLQAQYVPAEIEKITKGIFHNAAVTNSHNMLGIPLQLFIVTENFLDDVELYNKLSEEIFVLTKMYKIFFAGKKKHLYEKVGVQYEQQLGFNFNLYLENYEIPALRCCLEDNTFQRLNLEADPKNQEFLEMIKNEGDKFGIISQVNEGRAVFIHQTYAEYFACVWFRKNFVKVRILKDEFGSEKYQNLRLIFDIMLAENCPLHLAVIYRSSEQVKKHLSSVASRDEGGRSALHLICSYGNKYVPLQLETYLCSNQLYHDENQLNEENLIYQEIFTSLSQCDPFEVDEVLQWTALDYAFHFQCLYPVEKFLEQYEDKVKIDSLLVNLNKVSVIYYSAKLGYPYLLEAMLKRSLNSIHFKIGESKLSFLHVAVKGVDEEEGVASQKYDNKIKIIKILIQNGIDVNVKDKNGATPLHWAVSLGLYDLVKALLDEGAEINATNNREETTIHYSLQKWEDEVKVLKLDRSGDFDMNVRDRNGATLLHWACKENDYDLCKTLLENGMDVNVTNRIGETPLHYAVRSWKPDLEIINLLIDNGTDVNCSDIFGISPLHWAFSKGHYDVIGILHKKGANVTTITLEHKVILRHSYEALKPNMHVMEMLMDYGFNVNSKSTDGTSILHYVSEKGHLGTVKLLVANGANINAVTKNNETILHYASRGWNPKLIEMYTEIGIDVNAKDCDGTTAFHRAAENGNLKMVKVLLEQGANMLATNNHGETALTFAVKTQEPNLEIIKLLIQKGIDINSKDRDGVRALHWACKRGHYHVVKLLLDNGAFVNSVTKNKETPLHYTNPSSEILRLLLENGVSVNATDVDGMTALHWASERGQLDLVKILLEFGADVNSAASEDETVLIYTVKQRKVNLEVVKLLMKYGANVHAIDKDGMNALHWASESGHYDVVKLLLEKGIDVNSRDNKNETVLQFASKSWQPNTEVIKRLVAAGASINGQDADGTTALHWAAKEGHYTNVEVLVELGADALAVSKNKETTLHYASKAWKKNDSVLELLTDKNVNVNFVDKEGKTALHCAAEKGFYDNVKFLLEKGASVDAATNTNLTALHFAVYGGHVRIIKLLLEKGLNISKVEVKNVNLPLYFAVRNGNLKEDLLVMMAATIHEKFPLSSWKWYSYQEVTTYLQESQPYMESVPITRNVSTTISEHPSLFRSFQDLVFENVEHSMVWLRNIFNAVICRKVINQPRTPTFIVHYPVFPTDNISHDKEVQTPTIDRSYTF